MDRRSFLRTTGAVAGAAAAIPALSIPAFGTKSLATRPTPIGGSASSPTSSRRELTSTLSPWVPGSGQWNATTINHIYRRAGFGATLSEIAAASSMSPGAVIDALLDDSLITGANLPQPPANSDKWLHVPPYLGTDYTTQVQQQTDYSYAMLAIRRWWGALMSQPKTMLREKMCLFWMNHFVVEEQKVYYPQMMYNYLDYFRRNPWGNFKQMVKDVTVSPAMLIYLDGALSYGSHPNENYGRELMELFTLGVSDKDGNPNYTEFDIQQMARALTGWKIDYTAQAPNVLPGVYDISRHDSTLKSPFGAPKKDYGLAASGVVTDDCIDLLFQMKGDKLAYYICSKLYQFFVYHDITTPAAQAIIAGLAQTFQSGNWELKPVIAQLLKSEHFFDTSNIGAQLKSPYEYMIGMVRSLDLSLDELQSGTLFYISFYYFNQELLDPPNVKGWPGYHSWISTTTLPARNAGFAGSLVASSKGIAGIGASGYGQSLTGLSFSDAQLITWASQFPSYKGQFADFVRDVSQFLCPLIPSDKALLAPLESLFPNFYEWATLLDSDKINPLRAILARTMSLAHYQLI